MVFVVSSNHFNHNAKVPSIAKIETEIENGEDVTGPNHIKVFLQLKAPSWPRVLQAITPLHAQTSYIGSGHTRLPPKSE